MPPKAPLKHLCLCHSM